MARITLSVAAVLVVSLMASACGGTSGTDVRAPSGSQKAAAAFAGLPLTFVENRGQVDGRVRFHAQGAGHAIYLTRDEIALTLRKDSGKGVALALRLLGADPRVAPSGDRRAPGTANFLEGDDPPRWHTDVPGYLGVVYRDVWPGIDMRLRGEAGELKYEFRVRPGASVEDIRLAYRGATGLRRDGDGALQIGTGLGELRDAPPTTYQEIGGARELVSSRYVLGDGRSYGFAVGRYDHGRELIIDPSLAYSTLLGGTSHEFGSGIQVDAAGNAYVTGFTQSPNLPDDHRRLRPHRLGEQQHGRLRHQAQPRGHRARLLDLPRRLELRVGPRHRGRLGGQRVRDRQDDVLVVPDDVRRLRPVVQRRQLPAVRDRPDRRLHHEAEPRGLRPRLLHLPRRDEPGRDVRHRDRRRPQRLRDRRDDRQLPDDGRRVRHDRRRGIGRLRRQAQRRRLGARLRHPPRRSRQRAARGRGGRRGRQRDGGRVDALGRLPDDGRRVRQDPERRRVRRALRPVRHAAQRRRLRARLLDVPGRLEERLRRRLRARRGRQRLPRGRHAVARLPGHARRLRSRLLGRRGLRAQAQPDRLRDRLLDLPEGGGRLGGRARRRRQRVAGGQQRPGRHRDGGRLRPVLQRRCPTTRMSRS